MNTLGGAVYIGRFVGINNLKSARHVADIKNVSARSADGLIDDTGMSARKVLVDWRNVLYLSVGYVAEQEAQLMLTTGSTRLLAVSRARAISDGTLT